MLSNPDFQISENYGSILFDDGAGMFVIRTDLSFRKTAEDYYHYEQVAAIALYENGECLYDSTSGQSLEKVLDSADNDIMRPRRWTFCNSLTIRITLQDANEPVKEVAFLTRRERTANMIYRQKKSDACACLKKLYTLLPASEPRMNENSTAASQNPASEISAAALESDRADAIRKYKQLLDDGIITAEEFETKKKQLLNL